MKIERTLTEAQKRHISRKMKGLTRNKNTYSFVNDDGREFVGTRRAFADNHDVTESGVSEIIHQHIRQHRGWRMIM